MEAKDRELARTLYEKEKERLRRAKEKARLKAKNKVMTENREQEPRCATVSPVQNIAVCIDPTWNGGRQGLTTFRERTRVPVTDLGELTFHLKKNAVCNKFFKQIFRFNRNKLYEETNSIKTNRN